MYKFLWWLTWQRFVFLCLPVAAGTGGVGYAVVKAVDALFGSEKQVIAEDQETGTGQRRPASAKSTPAIPAGTAVLPRKLPIANSGGQSAAVEPPPPPFDNSTASAAAARGGEASVTESASTQEGPVTAYEDNSPPPGDPERMPAAASEKKKNEDGTVTVRYPLGGLSAGLPLSSGGSSSATPNFPSSGATNSGGGTGESGGATVEPPEVAQALAITSGGSPTQTTGSGYKVSTTIGPKLSAVKATTANGYQVKLGVQGLTSP